MPLAHIKEHQGSLLQTGDVKFGVNALMKGWHQTCNNTRTANEFDLSWTSVKANLLDPAAAAQHPWLESPPDTHTISCLRAAFEYIDKNKLPLRRRFASFAIDRVRHFGHTSTSIAEEALDRHQVEVERINGHPPRSV